MREFPERLAQGSIVWAEVPDPQGTVKRRPLIVITETSEIILDHPVQTVACTSSYPAPPPLQYVEIPWHPRGHPATGLSRRSAAMCRWLVKLLPSQVQEIRGFVPTKTLLAIVQRVRELNAEG
jgi:hypothetical protein